VSLFGVDEYLYKMIEEMHLFTYYSLLKGGETKKRPRKAFILIVCATAIF
jgi:hypothetical protein